MPDKKEEKQIIGLFCDYLNKQYNFNYYPEINFKEDKKDPWVDGWAKSSSGNHPNLDLQVVTSIGKIKEFIGHLRSKAKKTGRNVVMGNDSLSVEIEKWVAKAINQKYHKYPRADDRKGIVFLVGFGLGLINEKWAKEIFKSFSNYDFMGIYLVCPPIGKNESNDPHSGQIIPIKPIEVTKFNLCN